MTIGSKALEFYLNVTEVQGTSFYAYTRQDVKKRIADIIYLESPPADAVKLSFVGSEELSPKRDIYIGDRSDSIYGNTVNREKLEFISQVNNFSVRTKNFIATQIFNSAPSGDIPLFFKCILTEEVDHIIADSITVLDKNFDPVADDKYKVILNYDHNNETGEQTDPLNYIVYNSLESSFDRLTGEYEVYYIQYLDASGSVNVTVTKLLENELAYKEATFEDVWHVTLGLKPWKDAYTYSEVNGTITCSRVLRVGIRYIEDRTIKVSTPLEDTDTIPWYLYVSNGNINYGYDKFAIKYAVPEFNNQAFNPIAPYRLSPYTKAEVIDSNLIKLADEEIQFGVLFHSLDLVIKDEEENLLYAITNDEDKDGQDYYDFSGKIIYDSAGNAIKWLTKYYKGTDKLSGIVNVGVDLLATYNVYATYSYKETKYKLTSLNMNPIFDPAAQKETRAIYLVPTNCLTNPGTSSQLSAVKWVRIDKSGKIIGTNQDGRDGNSNLSMNVKLRDAKGRNIDGALDLHYSWQANTTSISGDQLISTNRRLYVSSTETFPRSGWIRFLDSKTRTSGGQTTDGIMRYTYYTNKGTDYFILTSDSTQIPIGVPWNMTEALYCRSSSRIELVNFLDERTTLSSRDLDYEKAHLYRNYSDIRILNNGPVMLSRYLVLAEVAVNPPHGIGDLVTIDVRQDGGGIIKEKYNEAKAINPRVQWFSDNGNYDGQVYPGNAAVVIKLPIEFKNRMTEDHIKQIVDECVVVGIMPIIKYYGYQPDITTIEAIS